MTTRRKRASSKKREKEERDIGESLHRKSHGRGDRRKHRGGGDSESTASSGESDGRRGVKDKTTAHSKGRLSQEGSEGECYGGSKIEEKVNRAKGEVQQGGEAVISGKVDFAPHGSSLSRVKCGGEGGGVLIITKGRRKNMAVGPVRKHTSTKSASC